MPLKTVRLALYGAIAVIALVSCGLYLSTQFQATGSQSATGQPSTLIGGPFTLTDQNGKTVTEKDLIGHPSLIFFGYTFCPDVCPTTLADTTDWLQTLGATAKDLRVYFVTVDPERDTPAKLKEYLSVFDPRIEGLSGTKDQTAQILKAYRVFARKVPQKDSADYLMDHSAAIYMMDAQGRFTGALTYQEPTDKVLAKLKQLVSANAAT